jgi:cobalt-zinc-cadmium efflux system membrane fusion protein
VKRLLLSIAALLALVGCPKNKNAASEGTESQPAPKADAHADEPEHEGIPKRVRVTPAVIKDARIATTPVVKESLAVTLSVPGELVADPDRSARVSTPVPGRLDQVLLREGAAVKKGDVVATVRVPELGKVRSANAATSAKAAAARANADRLQALVDKKLASTQEALSAKAEADALEAEAHALGEQLRAMGTDQGAAGPQLSLRAPVSGIVVTRDAVVGQPVTAEQTIATIADLNELWFLGRLFEKDLGRVKVGSEAEVQLNAYPKERFNGVVEYIAQRIDPVARTVTARIRLANREQLLKIGLFGTARVATGEGQTRAAQLVVPRTAVVDIAGKPVVFVRQADEDYELHDVVLGDSALGKVEVLNGLREGEQVVSEGAFTLKSVALKSTIAEEE